jgi:hypothetical protein
MDSIQLELPDLGNVNVRDTLLMVGGIALLVAGAGLILSTPTARGLLGQAGLGNIAGAAIPDFERYLRLRNM